MHIFKRIYMLLHICYYDRRIKWINMAVERGLRIAKTIVAANREQYTVLKHAPALAFRLTISIKSCGNICAQNNTGCEYACRVCV